MKITRENTTDETRYSIRGYGPGEILVNETVYRESILLSAIRIDASWKPPAIENWKPVDLDPLLMLDPEIVLIGTGDSIHLLGTEFLAHALRQGVGLEVMDTAAACRTFNILVGEGRRVAAGLIID